MRAHERMAVVSVLVGLVVGLSGSASQAAMEERTLIRHTATVSAPVRLDAVVVQANSRPGDARYYDITVNVLGRPMPTVSIYTSEVRQRPQLDKVLIADARHLADLDVTVAYSADRQARVCTVSVASACAAWLPIDPNVGSLSIDTTDRLPVAGWNGSLGPNRNAELVVSAVVRVDGENVETQKVRIPYAGQILAIAG